LTSLRVVYVIGTAEDLIGEAIPDGACLLNAARPLPAGKRLRGRYVHGVFYAIAFAAQLSAVDLGDAVAVRFVSEKAVRDWASEHGADPAEHGLRAMLEAYQAAHAGDVVEF
jgi:hypothetical protein